MRLVEDISLVEFYQAYRERLVQTRFKALILALVREADEPRFYADLVRYWTSVNDVTGDDFLFVVAAHGAAEALTTPAVIEADGWTQFSSWVATSRESGEDYARLSRLASMIPGKRPRSRVPLARDTEALANGNSSQVGALCRLLDVPESAVPCLHVSFPHDTTLDPAVIPVSAAGGLSVYAIIKQTVEMLGPILRHGQGNDNGHVNPVLEDLTRQRQRIAGLKEAADAVAARERWVLEVGAARTAEKLYRVSQLRERVTGSVRELVDEIVSCCRDEGRSVDETPYLQSQIDRAEEAGCLPRAGAEDLRSLIGAAFDASHLELLDRTYVENGSGDASPDGSRYRSWLRELSDIDGRISEAKRLAHRQESRDRSERIQAATSEIGSRLRAGVGGQQWDYFISYPRPDQDAALRLFNRYREKGRTFIDCRCMQPGEAWHSEIPSAQRRSKTSVVLITENTKDAHYQSSEIIRAVDMMRAGGHRIIPTLIRPGLEMPFGLEQVQVDRSCPRQWCSKPVMA